MSLLLYQEVLEVVALADRFSFVLLKEALGEQLSRHISQTSVLELLVHADMCHLLQLRKKCLKFIDNNADLMLKSDAFLLLPEDSLACIISRDTFIAPEVSVFRAVLRWKEHNKQSVEEMGDILKCVRLSEISPQELFEVVEPCSLFDEPSILKAIRVQMKPDLEQMQPRGKYGQFDHSKNLCLQMLALALKQSVLRFVSRQPLFRTIFE